MSDALRSFIYSVWFIHSPYGLFFSSAGVDYGSGCSAPKVCIFTLIGCMTGRLSVDSTMGASNEICSSLLLLFLVSLGAASTLMIT